MYMYICIYCPIRFTLKGSWRFVLRMHECTLRFCYGFSRQKLLSFQPYPFCHFVAVRLQPKHRTCSLTAQLCSTKNVELGGGQLLSLARGNVGLQGLRLPEPASEATCGNGKSWSAGLRLPEATSGSTKAISGDLKSWITRSEATEAD